jgi:hypothetical protein
MHLEDASATGKFAGPTFTGSSSRPPSRPPPTPVVAPNELDLPEDN